MHDSESDPLFFDAAADDGSGAARPGTGHGGVPDATGRLAGVAAAALRVAGQSARPQPQPFEGSLIGVRQQATFPKSSLIVFVSENLLITNRFYDLRRSLSMIFLEALANCEATQNDVA